MRERGIVVNWLGGFGFIEREGRPEGEENIFLHISQLSENVTAIKKGMRIEFDCVASERKLGTMQAINAKILEMPAIKGPKRQRTRKRKRKSVDYNSMTVIQLKDILRERGLKVSGRKAELISRIDDDNKPKKKSKKKKAKIDYNLMTVIQLKEILRERGLKVSGRKAELVSRIEDDEKSKKKPRHFKKKPHRFTGHRPDIGGDDFPLTISFNTITNNELRVGEIVSHMEKNGPILVTCLEGDNLGPGAPSKFLERRHFVLERVTEIFANHSVKLLDWPSIHRSGKRTTHPYITHHTRASVIVYPPETELPDDSVFSFGLTESIHQRVLQDSAKKWVILGDETGGLEEFKGKGAPRQAAMCWIAVPPGTPLPPLVQNFHGTGSAEASEMRMSAFSNLLNHDSVLCFTFPYQEGIVVEGAGPIGKDPHLAFWQDTLYLVIEYISNLSNSRIGCDIFIENVGKLEAGIGIIDPIISDLKSSLNSRPNWNRITFDQMWILAKSPCEHPWIGYPDALGHTIRERSLEEEKSAVQKIRQRTISAPYRQKSLSGPIEEALRATTRPLVFLKSLAALPQQDIADYVSPFFSGAIREAIDSLSPGDWQNLLLHMKMTASREQGQNATTLIHGFVNIDETVPRLPFDSDKFDFLLAMMGTSNHIGAKEQTEKCRIKIQSLFDSGFKPRPDRMMKYKNLSGGARDNQFDFSHIEEELIFPGDEALLDDESIHYLGAQAQSRALRAVDFDWKIAWEIEKVLLGVTTNQDDLVRRWILRSELKMDPGDFVGAKQVLETELPSAIGTEVATLCNDRYYLAALLKACALSGAKKEIFAEYSKHVSGLLHDWHPSQRIAYWCARWASEIGQVSSPVVEQCCNHLIGLMEVPLFTHDAAGVILACELLDLQSRDLIDVGAKSFMESVLNNSADTTREWVNQHLPNEDDWLAPLNFNYR